MRAAASAHLHTSPCDGGLRLCSLLLSRKRAHERALHAADARLHPRCTHGPSSRHTTIPAKSQFSRPPVLLSPSTRPPHNEFTLLLRERDLSRHARIYPGVLEAVAPEATVPAPSFALGVAGCEREREAACEPQRSPSPQAALPAYSAHQRNNLTLDSEAPTTCSSLPCTQPHLHSRSHHVMTPSLTLASLHKTSVGTLSVRQSRTGRGQPQVEICASENPRQTSHCRRMPHVGLKMSPLSRTLPASSHQELPHAALNLTTAVEATTRGRSADTHLRSSERVRSPSRVKTSFETSLPGGAAVAPVSEVSTRKPRIAGCAKRHSCGPPRNGASKRGRSAKRRSDSGDDASKGDDSDRAFEEGLYSSADEDGDDDANMRALRSSMSPFYEECLADRYCMLG
jgi:hypothetical protein